MAPGTKPSHVWALENADPREQLVQVPLPTPFGPSSSFLLPKLLTTVVPTPELELELLLAWQLCFPMEMTFLDVLSGVLLRIVTLAPSSLKNF